MPPARILIVEDEPVLGQAIRINLENLGYAVPAICHAGEQALEHVHSDPPDLVIMDVKLQGKLDGIQVAEQIREKLGIPVIFITAHSDEKTVKRAMAVAPLGYLLKPFQVRELQLTVELALQNHWMAKKLRESEEKYRNLTELSPNAILLLDPLGTITLCNQEAEYLIGSSAPAVIAGKHLSDLIAIEKHETSAAEIQGLFNELDIIRNIKLSAVRDDGKPFPVEVNGSLVRNDQGKPEMTILVIQDITDRLRAEQEVMEQARRAETLARVASHINSSLESDLVLRTVCDEVAQILDVPGVAITLLSENTDNLNVAAAIGPIDELNRIEQIPFPESLRELLRNSGREAIQIPFVQSIGDLPTSLRSMLNDVYTVVIAPMFLENWLIGSINLATTRATRHFNQDELSLLSAIADMAAIAISHARLFEQVNQGRRRLQTLSRQLVEVQEAERRHLANELHDQVGQMLTGLQFSLEMGKVVPEQEVKSNLAASQEIVKEIIAQVRELSLDLRPSLLDDMGLLACLEWHFERYFRQTGIDVDFRHTGLGENRFPVEIEITVFRIIQEALTNIARHAEVKSASVSLQVIGAEILVKIEDRGAGFDMPAIDGDYESVGLDGMRERANLVGGQLEISSTPGRGTRIKARIPTQTHIERRKHARNRTAGR